jgi:hypothetical protein
VAKWSGRNDPVSWKPSGCLIDVELRRGGDEDEEVGSNAVEVGSVSLASRSRFVLLSLMRRFLDRQSIYSPSGSRRAREIIKRAYKSCLAFFLFSDERSQVG